MVSLSCPLEFRFSWIDDMEGALEFHFPSARLLVSIKPEMAIRLTGPAAREDRGGDPAAAFRLEPGGLGAITTNQAFYLEWRAFLDGLATGRPSEFSAEAVLPVTALIADLYRQGRGA